jgi:hypothetical protein
MSLFIEMILSTSRNMTYLHCKDLEFMMAEMVNLLAGFH